MINPAIIEPAKPSIAHGDFWFHLLRDEQLRDCDDLKKLVVGCEIIATLDAVDLLAA